MQVNNPLYKDQGIHVIASLFTVENGITKVLLIKRKNDPFKDMWALAGGALYNNETIEEGIKREIFEKTGIKKVSLYSSKIFSDVKRSPVMRMIAVTFIGIIDSEKINLIKDNLKASDILFFPIDKIPELAYDHEKIIKENLETLREQIFNTNILRDLFSKGFTLPELQKTYEIILNKTYDRRNFRKKILSLDIIYDTNKSTVFEGKKPAKVYMFKD